MCTLSWINSPKSLDIFCNRDERRERKRATPPSLDVQNGIRYIAARDGEAGGTWFAVNEYGLAVSILNHYPAEQLLTRASWQTRGELPITLMGCRSLEDLHATFADISKDAYRPFWLIAQWPGRDALKYTWDGKSIYRSVLKTEVGSVTTSAFNSREVSRDRALTFDDLCASNPSSEALEAYHLTTIPGRESYTVCMSRPDAATLSYSRIRIDAKHIYFEYRDAPPFKSATSDPILLQRISEYAS